MPGIPCIAAMRTLILASARADLGQSVRQVVSAARQLGGEVHVLVVGDKDSAAAIACAAAGVRGVAVVKCAEIASDAMPNIKITATLLKSYALDYTHILSDDSGFCRAVLAHVAALLGVEPVTGVTRIVSTDTFVRPVYAGNAWMTVQSHDPVKILTVRTANFAPADDGGNATIIAIAPMPEMPSPVAGIAQLLECQCTTGLLAGNTAPPLDSARIVVAGGRGLGSAENFTALLAPLARRLGAALGASYGAVSAGYAANALQIGQTGRIIAPALYIAVGISGAIQHLAGIRDAQVVVAIDKNPEAPIFKAADYGLVADLFGAVPALTHALEALGEKT